MSEKIKISELTASSTTNNNDLIMIVQENSNNELENFKQTRQDFFAGIDLSNFYNKTESDNRFENKTNKVTSLSSSSTDTQYPSAKCVYDLIGDINNALDLINGESI